MYKSDAEDSARSPRSASTNGKAIGPANGLLKEDKANIQNSSSRPSAHSKQASAQHLQDKDINLAAASSKTLNGSAKLPGPLVDKTLRDHRATKPHNPCEVVVGETFEHGASCFVGVKIRDDAGNVMITIPTSAALEAACKARKDHSVFPRIMDHVKHPLGKQVIDVVGLPVWTKADPHHKVCLPPFLSRLCTS
jgi:hypothetical protein